MRNELLSNYLNLCIHKSLDLHNSGGSKMSLFYVEVTDDQKVSEGGGK